LFDVVVAPAEGHAAVVVVTVVGELDMATAPRLRQALVEATGHGARGVVVDLGAVDFLDSTGLGVLLGAVKRIRGVGGDLVLARAAPQVARVFEVTRLIEILPIHGTVESAVAALVAS
jgi:anti-sigma B factor antagonist